MAFMVVTTRPTSSSVAVWFITTSMVLSRLKLLRREARRYLRNVGAPGRGVKLGRASLFTSQTVDRNQQSGEGPEDRQRARQELVEIEALALVLRFFRNVDRAAGPHFRYAVHPQDLADAC